MTEITQRIFDLLSQWFATVLLAGGGGAALALWACRNWAEKWIAGRFDRQLEAYRHQQAMELQRLKVEIDAVLNGALKLQEREFHLLPEIWDCFAEAVRQLRALISPFRRQIDFDQISDEDAELMLKHRKYPELKIPLLLRLSVAERTAAFEEWECRTSLSNVREANVRLRDVVSKHAIFLQPELHEMLENTVGKIGYLIGTWEMNHQRPDGTSFTWTTVEANILPLEKSVQDAISLRLREHATPKAAIS